MSPVRIRYQTIEFDSTDIHLRTLRDNQQYSDENDIAKKLGISSATWPLFGVVWPSSIVLANFMLSYNYSGKRILEVGCGIGLVSLLLNHNHADISATDIHPEAEEFLIKNANLNNGKVIPFKRANWNDIDTKLGQFDLIVGSDLLYERENVNLLAEFINHHTKADAHVIIVDPGRGNHATFSKKMVALGYSHTQNQPADTSYLEKQFKGQILEYACHEVVA
ncbi:MAG: methyltransferase domain-containing protein [Gammaproteobacteria bacterium]|nr:methyltransferase domain-containing protein [Gammaproteobacteria bacterium]